jgi:hypothetical protein
MATQARLGAGTQFQFMTGSPATYTTVPEVTKLSFGGIEVSKVEVTNQDSPVANGLIFKELIGGLAEGKETTATFNYRYNDPTQLALQAAQDGNSHQFQIVLRSLATSPATTLKTIQFNALVSNWEIPDFPLNKQIEGSVKLTVTGAITFV